MPEAPVSTREPTSSGRWLIKSPDLPGCVATGKTPAEVTRAMQEAIAMHVQGILEDNLPVPEPRALAEYVAV